MRRSTLLFVRPIDTDVPLKLPGTDGAGNLFWSPDSRSIAFFAGGRLKKVQASGGPPENICDTPDMRGGTWNARDVILFASSKGLQRVKAVGGEPVPVATPKDAVPQSVFPARRRSLPVPLGPAQASNAAIYVGSLDSSDATRLVAAQSNAVYAEPGYLLYHREGTLYAQPFNPGKLATAERRSELPTSCPYSPSGAAAFSASRTGILIYRSSPLPPAQALRRSAERWCLEPAAGLGGPIREEARSTGRPAGWAGVDLSPNGKRVAAHRHDADGGDVWIFEPGQTAPAKFTFDAAQDNSAPIWTPDGTQVAFGSHRKEKWGIYIKLADSTRNEELLMESDVPIVPMTWTPDGQTFVYWTSTPKTQGDVWGLPMSRREEAVPDSELAGRRAASAGLTDGKWIAYSSNETGRSEIYVQPFPQGTKIQVSSNGGVYPRWGRGGQELYFMNLISAGNLMMSNIRVTGSAIQRDDPKVLFQTGYFTSPHPGGQYHAYAVSSDGQRFLIPQIDNPVAVFTGRGRGLGINTPAVIAALLLIATPRRLLRRARARQSTSSSTGRRNEGGLSPCSRTWRPTRPLRDSRACARHRHGVLQGRGHAIEPNRDHQGVSSAPLGHLRREAAARAGDQDRLRR